MSDIISSTTTGRLFGLPITREDDAAVVLYNRTGGALAAGDVVALDLVLESTEATGYGIGADSAFSNVIPPNAADQARGIGLVALEAIADNARGKFAVGGYQTAKVQKNSGNIAVLDPLVLSTAGNYLDADTAGGAKIVALALEAATGPSSATAIKVLFAGIHGLGSVNTTT